LRRIRAAILGGGPALPFRKDKILRHSGSKAEEGGQATHGQEQKAQKGHRGRKDGNKDGTHHQAHRIRPVPVSVLSERDHALHRGIAKNQSAFRTLSKPKDLLLITFPGCPP